MSTSALRDAVGKLTSIQREATNWKDGPMLVLAGPGSGKTRVLTCRIARILEASPHERFRILALTFTNKAAGEMVTRLAELVPDLIERVAVDTFHAFCAQVLRQHGAHIGIRPNFAIYSMKADRVAVLDSAIHRAKADGHPVSTDDHQYLGMIECLKSNPEAAGCRDDRATLLCRVYDEELRRVNALDFSSLISETCRLFREYPVIAKQYRITYRYWLVDEFQDINQAQYTMIRLMAGEHFRDIFAVADDDQTIYEWNGADVRRIDRFLEDFGATDVKFLINFRCTPDVVRVANRLIVHNRRRTDKGQTVSDRLLKANDRIQLLHFDTDAHEWEGVGKAIAELSDLDRERTAVLARNWRLLKGMMSTLEEKGIRYSVVRRREDFRSPEVRCLVAVLGLIARPLDIRYVATLVDSYNRIASRSLGHDELTARAEVNGIGYLHTWLAQVRNDEKEVELFEQLRRIVERPTDYEAVDQIVKMLEKRVEEIDGEPATKGSDLAEDLETWRGAVRSWEHMRNGDRLIPWLLQDLQLRSAESTVAPHSVTLATIHGAKGKEFDHVYLVGLANELLPSYQSLQHGSGSRQVEEERRNCFVAITRARERLTLSWASRYNGYLKEPSLFLKEMGLL